VRIPVDPVWRQRRSFKPARSRSKA